MNGKDVYLFGGRHKRQRLNDLYKLDLVGMEWTLIHPSIQDYVTSTPEGIQQL